MTSPPSDALVATLQQTSFSARDTAAITKEAYGTSDGDLARALIQLPEVEGGRGRGCAQAEQG